MQSPDNRPSDWPAPVHDVPLAQALHDIGAGRRPWPRDPNKKRHHFVPRFVLARYATASNSGGDRLWQLDKTIGLARKVLPEEAASRRRFYAVESDEAPRDNRIEDFLALVEQHAAGPIRTLCAQPKRLTAIDRTTIAMYLALQERRTPFGIAEAGAAVERHGREFMASLASDADRFRDMWREAVDSQATDAAIEKARSEVLAIATEGRMHLSNKREQGMLVLIDGWLELAEVIEVMQWYLLRPASGEEFIQNDQGVARLDTTTTFTAPHVSPQWLFPLAPDACLMVRSEGTTGLAMRGSTRHGTLTINLRIYGWAERFIFGRREHVVTQTDREAKVHPKLAAAPPRLASSDRRR